MAVCPEARLRDPSTLPHEPLEVRWECDNTVADHICHEISVGDEDRCLLGYYRSEHEGTFAVFYRRATFEPQAFQGLADEVTGALEQIVDRGITPDGPIQWSYYLHGADLHALARAGVTLGWQAACCLHAAIQAPLSQLHAAGLAHGALTARRIRLVASPEPYSAHEGPAPVPPRG